MQTTTSQIQVPAKAIALLSNITERAQPHDASIASATYPQELHLHRSALFCLPANLGLLVLMEYDPAQLETQTHNTQLKSRTTVQQVSRIDLLQMDRQFQHIQVKPTVQTNTLVKPTIQTTNSSCKLNQTFNSNPTVQTNLKPAQRS